MDAKALQLLGDHILQRHFAILFDDPFQMGVIVQQGGAEIRIAILVQEGIQGILGAAGSVRLTLLDLIPCGRPCTARRPAHGPAGP